MSYVYLALAIAGELLGTTLLKVSNGFSRMGIGLLSLLAYGLCFYFLSQALRSINLNLAYALWSGIGIIGTSLIGILIWKEHLNLPTLLGIALILAGVLVVNIFGSVH